MLSVQGGTAIGVLLLPAMSAPAAAWVRLALGAVVMLAWVRPSVRGRSAGDLLAAAALGAAVALMSVCSALAVSRIPFGTASAIEFLGPLTVALVGLRRAAHLLWPLAAVSGVVLLTRPWSVAVDLSGVLFALGAALGWGLYILLNQRVGDRFSGIEGLALSAPVAAVLSAVPAWSSGGITRWDLRFTALAVVGTLLTPLCCQVMEMYALRHLTAGSVALLNSKEPAIALGIGLVVLGQAPTGVQVVGVALVCVAGYGAIRSGQRHHTAPVLDPAVRQPTDRHRALTPD